jgi:hypothetical protein
VGPANWHANPDSFQIQIGVAIARLRRGCPTLARKALGWSPAGPLPRVSGPKPKSQTRNARSRRLTRLLELEPRRAAGKPWRGPPIGSIGKRRTRSGSLDLAAIGFDRRASAGFQPGSAACTVAAGHPAPVEPLMRLLSPESSKREPRLYRGWPHRDRARESDFGRSVGFDLDMICSRPSRASRVISAEHRSRRRAELASA